MPKRTPKELWDELVAEAGEEEIEKAASVSVAQAEAELRAAGVDVDADRARARRMLGELEGRAADGGAPQEQHAPPRRPVARAARYRVATGVLAAAAGVCLVIGVAKIARDSDGVTHPVPSTEDLQKAADLRRRASTALAEGHPQDCLPLLDEARTKDPVGDSAPEVVKLREDALRALGRPPPR
jgi:hypothetical protein